LAEVELLKPTQFPRMALEELLLDTLAVCRVVQRQLQPVALLAGQLVPEEVKESPFGHLGQSRFRSVAARPRSHGFPLTLPLRLAQPGDLFLPLGGRQAREPLLS